MKLEKASWIAAILAIPVAFFVWYFKPDDFNSFFKSLGKLICTPFSMVFNWLTHPITWPVWALILLAISGLAIVAGLFYLFSRASEASEGGARPIQIDPLDYRTDEIFGVQWTWSFVYGKLNENDLSAFCPRQNCMCRLTMKEDQQRMQVRQGGFGADLLFPISFTCSNCGYSREFDSNWKQLKHSVFIEIERRIRTGEFQQRMTPHKS
jgi:hypothetical protein